MDPGQDSDEYLMQQVAAGREEAFSTLLRRYAHPLLTFIRRMTGKANRSEELFQEVFLAVWSGRRRYQAARPFRSWLFGIAANKCREDRRQQHGPILSLSAGDVLAPVAVGPSPAEQVIGTETTALVEQCVLRLPPQQRAVVILRVWNCLSYREIAEALDQTEGTARSTMFHALNAMRKYLEPRMR